MNLPTMQLLRRPYYLLTVLAVILLVLSFFVTESFVDIHVHDTYYVIAYPHLFWITALLLLFFALLYRLTRSILFSGYLTWLQLIITFLFIFSVLLYPSWGTETPRHFIDISNWTSNRFDPAHFIIRWLLIVFIFGQLLLLANITMGIKNKISRRSHTPPVT